MRAVGGVGAEGMVANLSTFCTSWNQHYDRFQLMFLEISNLWFVNLIRGRWQISSVWEVLSKFFFDLMFYDARRHLLGPSFMRFQSSQ